ncbi:MAG: phenylalanine--tRNA ligase subunit alpha [Candidatus Woesearchaeota archaeon]
MNAKKIAETLHALERKVLPYLKEKQSVEELISKTGLKEVEVNRALQWLKNKELITLEEEVKEIVELDSNGRLYLKEGLPERKFIKVLGQKTLTLDEISKKTQLSNNEISVSIGLLRRKNIIYVFRKKDIIISLTEFGKKLLNEKLDEEKLLEKLPIEISKLSDSEKIVIEGLKKRKNIIKISSIKTKTAKLTQLGEEVLKVGFEENVIDKLTPEIIKSKVWKQKKFRRYDIQAEVPEAYFGRRHFVNEAIDYIRKIWIGMGFKEMKGPLIQTSFWNFDALFTAQDHPVREMQDTFFIKNPEFGILPDKRIVDNVKKAHENGFNTGSIGWQYKWSFEEAKKNVLRTHTTVLSARTIASLKKEDLPVKYFAVGRCFRNETLDWSHLFEFDQTEGIVVGDVNFRNLVGYLKEFFKKMGYERIRIRPAYFPYTEMSCEVEVYDENHEEWLELGGAGMLRPEVVKPLLGFETQVLAWGLGLARIIKNYYQIDDLRTIYKNDLGELRKIREWLL